MPVSTRVDLTAPQVRALVRYLLEVRAVIGQAVEARRRFVHEVGLLIDQARHGNTQAATQATGRLGREQVVQFREARSAIQRLSTPAAGEQCHEAVAGWIEMHVAACEVMVEVGSSGDLKRLREAQSLLAEGRRFAGRFNAEYQALAVVARSRTEELRRRGERPGSSSAAARARA